VYRFWFISSVFQEQSRSQYFYFHRCLTLISGSFIVVNIFQSVQWIHFFWFGLCDEIVYKKNCCLLSHSFLHFLKAVPLKCTVLTECPLEGQTHRDKPTNLCTETLHCLPNMFRLSATLLRTSFWTVSKIYINVYWTHRHTYLLSSTYLFNTDPDGFSQMRTCCPAKSVSNAVVNCPRPLGRWAWTSQRMHSTVMVAYPATVAATLQRIRLRPEAEWSHSPTCVVMARPRLWAILGRRGFQQMLLDRTLRLSNLKIWM